MGSARGASTMLTRAAPRIQKDGTDGGPAKFRRAPIRVPRRGPYRPIQ